MDDNLQDREALIRSLKKAGEVNSLLQFDSGEEALDYLFRRGNYKDHGGSQAPAAVFLDLNMPGTDGLDVLSEMRQDVYLRGIPVIVFSASCNMQDVDACYAAGANCYVQKPMDCVQYAKVGERLGAFWFGVATLPQELGEEQSSGGADCLYKRV